MNPPTEDIKDMLEASSSLGLVFGTNLFIGKEPDAPNDCVSLFDTPGRAPQFTYQQGEDYFYPSIQIRVRSSEYLVGWALVNDVKTYLHARTQERWGDSLYTVVACAQEPFLLDWDPNRRPRFVTNFNLQRR